MDVTTKAPHLRNSYFQGLPALPDVTARESALAPPREDGAPRQAEHPAPSTASPNTKAHLPVADNSVDVVLSNCVINLSPDKEQVWREIFRVLKPGGKAAVSDLALLKPLPENIRTMAAALVGCVGGAILVEQTRAILEKTGFSRFALRSNPGYVQSMQDWNDPLYAEIAKNLPHGKKLADFVVSLTIEAYKE